MVIACPQCGQQMSVDQSLVGRQVQCPSCRTTVTVGAPAGQGPPPAYAPVRLRRMPAGPGGSSAAKVFMIFGAIAMIGAFATPWWWASITIPDVKESELSDWEKEERKDQRTEAMEEREDKRDFYRDHKLDRKGRKASDRLRKKYDKLEDRRGKGFTILLWGWECTQGILCLVFGLLILIYVILAMSVGVIGRWSWIGSFASMGMGILVVILAAMWWVDSPGKDVVDSVTQGAFIGTFVALGGGVLVAVSGLSDGIAGLVAMARRGRAR